MRIVEAGDHPSSSRIDETGIAGAKAHDLCVLAKRGDFLASDRESLHFGPIALQGRYLGVVHDQVRGRVSLLRLRLSPEKGQ
jgi:hypothetical protein